MKKQQHKEVFTWPDLVVMEFITAVALTIILVVWALLVNAPLLEVANPGMSENPSKAPWYFVGLQELLVYFDPWIAGVAIPAIIIMTLAMIPYLDNNTRGIGRYALNVRRFAVINFMAGLSMWWLLIIIGYFFRGPDWRLSMPGGSREIVMAAEDNLRNFSSWQGIALLSSYFAGGLIMPAVIWRQFYRRCGKGRYMIVMFILLLMYFIPLKMILRLVFDIRYILVTPWFNI